ncbi:MAG: nitrate reductase molybdenum cofactor assembly chaperone [Candidatus Omnitrophica bacterium]|nr:nitrate reductase molybdenum cofactor assembly chaperone [Candidatus Omnitrophota bacterium]MDE2009854.1 nitrate reductase molybdenum cofactor assembly chaperone [Candidatus Omnitrophota bacterium]MDE2214364.1 nitrate reductase molybdenum cofactor assembly chaperone [Candidatus Omnitrophota bacterium]MDE2231113.1 nitrate reductase molybdenum cofactor assembly chaperone [Candidatus Omnitrophota bacterium]
MNRQTDEWTMQTSFQWISYLLVYPDGDWTQTVREVKDVLSISHPMANGIQSFLEEMDAYTPEQRWDHYVHTFDFGKKTNLYLTFADYGEERERGPALLELKEQYAMAGFELKAGEMPDYLPVVLEFCAHTNAETAGRILFRHAARIAQLQESLSQIESPYAHLLRAVRQGIGMMQPKSNLCDEEAGT